MSAPIVYEGFARPSEPLQNGIFKGMKIWLSHHVPARLERIQTIQNNGGKIVVNERNAEYFIINPAKDTVLRDSYSYQLIDDSVKNGALPDLSKYICSKQNPQSQPTAVRSQSAVPQKTRRTPFTPEDDKLLRQWVTEKQRAGEAISGNVIYQELEEKHPHHTWNSWRDRWVKKLSKLPQPRIPDASPQPRQSTESPAQSPPRTIRDHTPQKSGRLRIRARPFFNMYDDRALLQHIRECVKRNESIYADRIFHDLAKDFPRHTMQEWKTRWLTQVMPSYQDKLAEWASEADVAPATSRDIEQTEAAKTPEQRQTSDYSHARFEVAEARTPVSNTTEDVPTRRVVEAEEAVETQDQDNLQQQQSPTTVQEEPQAKTHAQEDVSTNLGQSPLDDHSLKVQFYDDYKIYISDMSEQCFTVLHTIKGRTFELWDLWQAVTSQKMEPEERDWKKVAEDLGYDWVLHDTIDDELRERYEEYLAKFEETLADFDANSDDDGDDDDEEEQDEENQVPEVALPSSPPILPSSKRPLESVYQSASHEYPMSSPKRRRVDRNGEVPSTPDHVNGTSHLRDQIDIDVSPAQQPTQDVDGEVAEDESRDIVHDLPPLPRAGKKTVEPETQEFTFDPETQNIILETEDDVGNESQIITPSQQLRQESDAMMTDIRNESPTPKASNRNINQLTPTPRRTRRIPFHQDSDAEMSETTITNDQNDTPTTTTAAAQAKRRTLPKSFPRKPSPNGNASASTQQPRQQPRSPAPIQAQPAPRKSPAPDTPDDIIDRFYALGYPIPIVLQALRATTWHLGDAGQVMEMLKQGQELPQRTSGVWTQRDDEQLKLVFRTDDEQPRDEKAEKKRERARKRLEAKHGVERMRVRCRYLWEDA